MPYAGTPVIQDGKLLLYDAESIVVSSSEWFEWLDTAERFSFVYSPVYCLTVRKEKWRNDFYWYAYLKHQGKLLKAYVGRSDTLTQERLEDVAKHLIAQLR